MTRCGRTRQWRGHRTRRLRLVYRHRVFHEPVTAAAAAAVLVRYVDQLATGRGHRDAPVGDDWRDKVADYLADDVWTVFLVGGQQVAGWSEGELVVRSSGSWDQPLDDVPHTRVPWSWLLVGLEDERGGGSLEMHHPLTRVALGDHDRGRAHLLARARRCRLPVRLGNPAIRIGTCSPLAAQAPRPAAGLRADRASAPRKWWRPTRAAALVDSGAGPQSVPSTTSAIGPASRCAQTAWPSPSTKTNYESWSSPASTFRNTCWKASAAPSSNVARTSTTGSATPTLWVCPSPATTLPCTCGTVPRWRETQVSSS